MPSTILVFDIGGTSTRTGLYDAVEDRLLTASRIETPNFRAFPALGLDALAERLMAAMADEASNLCAGTVPAAVAVAFPGPIAQGRWALAAPTVWGNLQKDGPLDLLALLRRFWPDQPIHLLNDMSAAGLYHARGGDGDFCVLTVSSGIGHKVFIRGQPLIGRNGRGGEIGHWRVDDSPEAPPCECGGRGHLAAVSSGAAVARHLRRLFSEDPGGYARSSLSLGGDRPIELVTNEAFAAAFRGGDAWTLGAARRMTEPLGKALAAIHLSTGVERFVLLGGLSRALGQRFRHMVAEAADRHCWHQGADWLGMVELGDDHDDAGLIGAGRFAMHAVETMVR